VSTAVEAPVKAVEPAEAATVVAMVVVRAAARAAVERVVVEARMVVMWAG